MWDALNSGQVLTLTFEFSSPRPHHLMPLNCFSPPLILHSYPPPPPPYSFISPSFSTSFPPCVPSSTSIPPVCPLLYISASAHRRCPPLSLAPSLPGEWQAHKCSNDSGGSVSLTAIAAVTGVGSAWAQVPPPLLQPNPSHTTTHPKQQTES